MAEQPNTSGVSTNLFNKGMVKDLNETFVGEGFWTHARNAVNNNHDGQQGTIGNEPANLKCITLPYDLIGAIHVTDDIWALFTTDDTNSEIGLFDESKCTYTKVVNDPCLNFNRANLISGVSRRRYDCNRPVYWADGGRNPDRFMDMDNPPFKYTESVIDGCIVKNYTSELDCEAIRLASLVRHPKLSIAKGVISGTLPNGSYQACIAYTINQTKITDYIGITEVQSLFSHQNVNSSLEISISDIDENFDEFELVILANINAQTVAKRIGYYSTSQGKIYLDRWDTEFETVPVSQVVFRTTPIEKSDSLYSVNDYLIRVGTYSKFKFNYQKQANNIIASWVAVEYPSDYYRKGGNNTGYMRDEQYPYFIRFIHNTGERTESYHIPGRAATLDDKSLVFTDDAFENKEGQQVEKWKVYNTATVEELLNNPLPDGGKVIAKGKMAYWESTELYDATKPEIWGDLCGKPIRHHKMPDETVNQILSSFNNSGNTITILGVQFSNITHPLDNEGNPITSIVGYEILRGSREGNKSIIAKGLFNNMREYNIPGNTTTKGLFQNYPYNDLRPDSYLTTKEQTGTNGTVNVTSPKMTGASKTLFSFHSPETTFSNPFLNGYEIKLYQEQHGTSTGRFEVPYKHPKFKVLTDFAETLTDFFSILSATSIFTNKVRIDSSEDVPLGLEFGPLPPIPKPGGSIGGILGGVQFGIEVAKWLAEVVLLASIANTIREASKERFVALLLATVPKRQYAAQYVSHGFYNQGLPNRLNNIRRKLLDANYVGNSIQSFTSQYQINNINRSQMVVLKIEQPIVDPTVQDNSRFIISETSEKKLGVDINRNISSYYGSIKLSIPSQYGQLSSIKQVIASPYVSDISPNKISVSEVIFGGDVYINRFTEKNTMFFFNNWLFGEPDEYEYDYTLYMNIPYPRFWINNNEYKNAFIQTANDFRSLDEKKSGTLHVKSGYFYLFNSGVRDFFVESEINTAQRDWEDDVQKRHYDPYEFTDLNSMFRSDIIRSGNYYKYDYSLSISKLFNSSITWGSLLPKDYEPTIYSECYTYRRNSVMYSLPQQSESKKDNWRVFLPNNIRDFNSPVNSIKSINKTGALFMMERQSPLQFMGVEELRLDGTGAKVTIGDGGLFNQALQNIINTDESYEYGSCQSRFGVSSNTHGVFWVSQNQGKIFQYNGQLNEISRDGMKWWFAQYLPSKLLEVYPDFPLRDNPIIGVGVQMIYDNTNEVLYISKKDYLPKVKDLLYDDKGFYYINGVITVTKQGPDLCPPGYSLINGTCVRRTVVEPIININGNQTGEGENTENCDDCSQFISDNYGGTDYYLYPTTYCVYVPAGGEYFELLYDSLGRPNRFTVYDVGHNLVGSSGWVGDAQYTGPWGMELSTLSNGTLRINKPSSYAGTYYIRVEAGNANPNPELSLTDNFQINFSCPTTSTETPEVVVTYSCPSGYYLINETTEPKCERIDSINSTPSTIVTEVPNKIYVSLDDENYFENASWTISYDPKSKTWISFHDWHPQFMLPGKNHFMTVKNTGVWKHNLRCDLYCNYYDKDYPFEVEYISATGQQVTTTRSLEYLMEVYRYHNNCKDKFHVLDLNFDQSIIYNSEQVSGLLELYLSNKDNPLELLSYPEIGLQSIKINYTKEEQKYRLNQFWDITKDRGEFTNTDLPMFITKPDGYRFEINPGYVNYAKDELERKKFRHNVNRVWFRRHISANNKIIFKFSNQKYQLSLR